MSGSSLDNKTRKVHSDKLVYDETHGGLSPMISCRFDKATALELKRLAEEQSLPVARIVRDLIDEALYCNVRNYKS